MIWDENISFEGFQKKIDEWYIGKESELCDPPINAQFALDLIFKTLVDDKENYEYLTTMPESAEQTNSIMLDLILAKYSRKYRKFKKDQKKQRNKRLNSNCKCIEIDCRICRNCTGTMCRLYGENEFNAIQRCAEEGFKNYKKVDNID